MAKVSEIDELIDRNKQSLRKIEQSKQKLVLPNTGAVLSLQERFSRHWHAHSQTWSTVVFSGCLLVLSLRLLSLKKEAKEIQESMERENKILRKENARLQGNVENMEMSWTSILSELSAGSRWIPGRMIENVEQVINETRIKNTETKETESTGQERKPKRKGFLI